MSASLGPAAGSPATAAAALDAVAALADPQRREILLRLTAEDLCTCTDLVAELGIGQPTVSHHLKVLRDAGLVVGERCGRFVNYTAVAPRLRDIAEAFAGMADRVDSPRC